MTDQTPAQSGPDVGAWIMNAVVAQFFSPSVVGIEMTSQYIPGGNGPLLVPTPKYGQSPLAMAANAIYYQRRDEIVARIGERIDVDELSGKIAEKMLAELTEPQKREYGAQMNPVSRDIRDRVRERLVKHYTAEAVATYDAEQAEMRAAWERERRRAAEAPPQIENGPQQ